MHFLFHCSLQFLYLHYPLPLQLCRFRKVENFRPFQDSMFQVQFQFDALEDLIPYNTELFNIGSLFFITHFQKDIQLGRNVFQ